jgi:predicted RNA-binding protein (virulence factor B family)
MLKIGNYNKMKLKKIAKDRAWLTAEGQDVSLPKREIPEGAREGDTFRVFVFNDTRDTLRATTVTPTAVVGQFAYMVVNTVEKFGAFLEWGIKKDLFLPERLMIKTVRPGEKILVRVVDNHEKNGVVADADWKKYLKEDQKEALKEGQRVPLIAMDTSRLGTRVIVDNSYVGLVYKAEVYKEPYIGQRMTGYVMKVREDGKIDISFKRKGWNSVVDSKDDVLEALKKAGGFLPLHDKSDPEEIKQTLGISKKLFKKSVGNLMAAGKITMTDDGIKLKSRS